MAGRKKGLLLCVGVVFLMALLGRAEQYGNGQIDGLKESRSKVLSPGGVCRQSGLIWGFW